MLRQRVKHEVSRIMACSTMHGGARSSRVGRSVGGDVYRKGVIGYPLAGVWLLLLS